MEQSLGLAHSDTLVELQFFLVALLCVEWVRLDLVVLHLGHDLNDQLDRRGSAEAVRLPSV